MGQVGVEILGAAGDQRFPNSSFSQRKDREGQVDEQWVCGALPIPGHLLPAATPTLSFQCSSFWNLFFHVQSVSWASHSPGRKSISLLHWIDFLLFSGSDFIPELW